MILFVPICHSGGLFRDICATINVYIFFIAAAKKKRQVMRYYEQPMEVD